MQQRLGWQFAFCLGVSVAAVAAGALELTKDNDNVTADRLAGTWVVDEETNERIHPDSETDDGMPPIEFVPDDAVAMAIPDRYGDFFQDKPVYLAGLMRLGGSTFPFVLTTYHGNPHIIYFLERDRDPFGEALSFNVMLVSAEDSKADMLFLGGMSADQPFTAFVRDAMIKEVALLGPDASSAEPVRIDPLVLAIAEARVAMGEAVQLLEAGRYRDFMERFAKPTALRAIAEREGGLELVVSQFKKRKASKLLMQMHALLAASTIPTISEDGATATFATEDGEVRVVFEREFGRWYLRN